MSDRQVRMCADILRRVPLVLLVAVGSAFFGCSDIGEVKPHEKAGYEVYKEYCSQCHAQQSPTRHTAEDWPGVVERMRIHMKEKKRNEITDKQAEEVLIFLKGHAKK